LSYTGSKHQATSLEEIAKQTGLLINPQKTKTMRINTTQTDKLTIRDTEVENVEQFTYLGSIISTTRGTDEDIKARKRKAQQAFAMLKICLMVLILIVFVFCRLMRRPVCFAISSRLVAWCCISW
jgi:hypothetical protein